MKKILLLDDNFHSDEKGSFIINFERQMLTRNGFDVCTLTFPSDIPTKASVRDFFVQAPKGRIRQKSGKFLGDANIKKRIKEVFDLVRPDLIHCHLISKYPAEVYCALDERLPVIQTLHGPNLFCATSWGCRKNSAPCEMGIGPKCYTRGCMSLSGAALYTHLNGRTWKNLLKKIAVFHCPSRNIMNTALRLGIQSVAHIPLGINPEFMSIERGLPSGPPTAMFVGTLEKCKGIDVLIEAMPIVLKSVPNAKLRIAGKGALFQELKEKIEALGLEGSVSLLGHMSHKTLIEEYRSSDVLVVPSIWQEQFGLVGPEAMACGLPCIGSDIGGIPEWLNHDNWGTLVPPGNVGHLAQAVVKYLSNRPLAYRRGLLGRDYARKHFCAKRYGADLLSLINCTMFSKHES